ncbi:ATP-binding protein [Streptomyces sp. NPDC059718]
MRTQPSRIWSIVRAARACRVTARDRVRTFGLIRSASDGTWPLEHRPEVVSVARKITRTTLGSWRIGAAGAEAVVLVVSELVTNALEHAQPPMALHLEHEHAGLWVWVGVSDGGPAESDSARTVSCANDEHGRGLPVIDALSADHGTHIIHSGVIHWAWLWT